MEKSFLVLQGRMEVGVQRPNLKVRPEALSKFWQLRNPSHKVRPKVLEKFQIKPRLKCGEPNRQVRPEALEFFTAS